MPAAAANAVWNPPTPTAVTPRLVAASTEASATPNADPNSWPVLTSAETTPASLSRTWCSAAVVAVTRATPTPALSSRNPGSTASVACPVAAGSRVSRVAPTAAMAKPAAAVPRKPICPTLREARCAPRPVVTATGR